MARKAQARLKSVRVAIKTPFMDIEGTWKADEQEQRAAWELYVELVTRTSMAELKEEEGLLREALNSLHTIFRETRDILKKYGPSVAKPKGRGTLSLGYLAISVLNTVLRPVLSYWHPLLSAHESTKAPGDSPVEHERAWEKNKELRDTLKSVRDTLKEYSVLLAEVAGVPPIEM